MSNGTPMVLLSWCPSDAGAKGWLGANSGPCNVCKLEPPPSPPPPLAGLPPFTLGVVIINQVQIVYGTYGNPVLYAIGQVQVETHRVPIPPDYSTTEIIAVESGAFGQFPSWGPPYTAVGTYQSTLQITYPIQNQTYPLPDVAVGGTGSPQDIAAAEQAAINQAYATLGVSPP